MAIGGLLGGGGGGGGGGGLIGGVIGGSAGTVAGIVSGIEEKKLAARERRRFRTGYDQGVARSEAETYDILNSPEFQAARNFALGTFGLSPGQGAGVGTTFGGETFGERPLPYALSGRARKEATYLGKVLGHSLLRGGTGGKYGGQKLSQEQLVAKYEGFNRSQQRQALSQVGTYGFGAKDFLPQAVSAQLEPGGGALGGGPAGSVPGFGLDSPLARDFATSIQQAQTTRGLFRSNVGAAAEASGLAAFNFQQQKELLPFMLGLAQAPNQIFQNVSQGNIAGAIQRASGGTAQYGAANPFREPAVIGPALQAGAAAFGGGSAIGSQYGGGGGGYGGGTPLAAYGTNTYQSPYTGYGGWGQGFGG